MNKYLFSVLLTCLSSSLHAQQTPAQAVISGRVFNNQDTSHLKVVLTRNYIVGQGNYENLFYDVPTDKNGNFHLALPAIEHIGRLMLYDQRTFSFLLSNAIVEPGDSAYIQSTMSNNDNNVPSEEHISGSSGQKFTCLRELQAMDIEKVLWREKNKARMIDVADSLLGEGYKVLDRYKQMLSPAAYNIIRADLIGRVGNRALLGIMGTLYPNNFPGKLTSEEIAKKKERFEQLENTLKTDLPAENLAFSVDYTDFIYQCTKWDLALVRGNANFSLKDLYLKLAEDNIGIFRDKLLAYCLINSNDLLVFFDNTTAEDYSYCMKDAIDRIRTSWLKDAVADILKTKGIGAQVYNFRLPADSSATMVSMSDFKGKVVLVDMWSYQCTACTLFSQSFHKSVYPLFESDPNFKVVSIMIGPSSREKYLFRLRSSVDGYGTKFATYTYPDVVNLFGGLDDKDKSHEWGKEIGRFYNINTTPFILLIDKNGKILSSTVPFFTNTESPNVGRMIDLIRLGLSKPG